MMSDSDEEDAESPSESSYKKLKTHDSPKVIDGNQAAPVSASSSSSLRETSGELIISMVITGNCYYVLTLWTEEKIYSQFSKPDKEKAQQLLFKSIESKCLELLQELLQLGVDIDIKDEVGVAVIGQH